MEVSLAYRVLRGRHRAGIPLWRTLPGVDMTTRRQAIKAADAKALRTLASSPGQGKDGHLGDFVFWVIPQEWRMPCPDVAAALQRHGLDPVPLMPEATPYDRAFSRAVESVRASVKSLGYTLAEAKNGPKGEKRVNVLHTTKADILDPTDEGSILCATDGKQRPWIERYDQGNVVKQILDKTDDLVGVYKKTDLAVSIAVLLRRWSAVPLLDGGYLLPPGGETEINAMKDAMADMSAGFIGQMATYAKDARSVETAAYSVNLSLEAQLNKFAKDAESYTGKTDTLRASTVEHRLEEASRLKQVADLHRAILGAAVSNIDAKVQAIETSLKQTLGLLEAE